HILDIRSQEYYENPNFEPLAPNVNNPKLAPIAHESRLFGGNFTWRGFHFTYQRMNRIDHSALGRNLMSVSWSNPGNRLSERWETLSIGHRNRKQSFLNTFSLSRYRVDNNSSNTYLFNNLFLAEYKTRFDSTQPEPQRKAIRDEIFNKYASGERYASANALDLRLESRVRAAFSTRLYWDFGLQLSSSLGSGITAYYTAPVEERHFTDYVEAEPFNVPNLSAADLRGNLFTQWAWRGKKLRLLAGTSAYASLEQGQVHFPLRLAGGYRIDSSWALYANYGTGVRAANGYEHANRFVFYYTGSTYDAYSPFSEAFDAMTTVEAFEAGVRFTKDAFRVKGSFFQQKAYNLIRGGYLVSGDRGLSYAHYEYGYRTAPGLSMSLWGVQGLITSEDQEIPLSTNGRRHFQLRGRTEFFMQYMEGKEYFGQPFPSSAEIRNQPRWMAQFRFWTGTDKFEFMAASNLQQSVLSKAATYAEFWHRDAGTLIHRYQRFRSWDFMLRIYLSKHLVAYCSIQNAFNKQISGLDATGTPEDLNFPIQQGRVWRFGVNYNLGE
ncbi:MAG TPA: TonB-dependent receptor, partial [Saprospiraceae bacterium]|nr:TonB-dependent receptor [Saprospiraceae bacterium]